MALDNYSDLQTAVLTWLGRAGDASISSSVPDMITLFEAEARRRMRTMFNETESTITTVAGTAEYPLPSYFGGFRSTPTVTSNDPVIELLYVTPEEANATWVGSEANDSEGPLVAYTIIGQNIKFFPTPQEADTVSFSYVQGITGLVSAPGGVNWLLTNHPDAYLFGTLAEAEPFVGDDDRFPLWLQRREQVFESILLADRKARWSGAPLQIKTDTGNP
jgi:hypothetical protein